MGNSMSSSLAPECTEAKKVYDDCFNHWYTEKFLKSQGLNNECESEWIAYQECFKAALVKKGIVKMLDEAENDAPFDKGGLPRDNETKSDNKK